MKSCACEQLHLFPALDALPAPRVDANEMEQKKEMMLLLEKQRQGDLEIRRRVARHFVYSNQGMLIHRIPNVVCSDDVNDELSNQPLTRHHKNSYRNNLNGATFKAPGWVYIGEVRSKRKGGHGNKIGLWTLKDFEAVARAAMQKEE